MPAISVFARAVNPILTAAVDIPFGEWLAWLEGEGRRLYGSTALTAAQKTTAPLYSPTLLYPGANRNGVEAVASVSALAFDFDGKAGNRPDMGLIFDLLHGLRAFAHTTISHTVDAPRFRVIVELSRPITAVEQRKLHAIFNERFAAYDQRMDMNALGSSRMWVFPQPDVPGYVAVSRNGIPLDPAELVAGNAEAVRNGGPVVAPQEGRLTKFATVEGDLDLAAWKPAAGERIKGYCPSLEVDERQSTSAWIRRLARGSMIFCNSANHDHAVPASWWLPDHQTGAFGRAVVPVHIENMLDWWLNKDGTRKCPKSSKHNLLVILTHDERVSARFQYDLFAQRVIVDGKPITDDLQYAFQTWIERTYQVEYEIPIFTRGLRNAALEKPGFDPLLTYLNGLTWDGTDRLSTLLHDAFGCPADPLHAAIMTRWMIQAVARAMRPGCDAELVLMLQGDQGFKKSRFFAILAGQWGNRTKFSLEHRTYVNVLSSAWIHEIAEFTSFRKSDINDIKQFLSQPTDNVVPLHQTHPVDTPRRCVFGTTINDAQVLTDETGNRRYLPATVLKVLDEEWLKDCRDQLWAEAVVRWRRGEKSWFDERPVDAAERSLTEQLRSQTSGYTVDRPWAEAFINWAEANPDVKAITTLMFARSVLDRTVDRVDGGTAKGIGVALTVAGWRRKAINMGSDPRMAQTGSVGWYVRPGVSDDEARDYARTVSARRPSAGGVDYS